MRYAAKRDTSHAEVRDTLRAAGCVVYELAAVVDFLVLCDGVVRLVDAKTSRKQGGKDSRTTRQQGLMNAGFVIDFAYGAEDAIALVQVWRHAAAMDEVKR